jgi:hypothetical protein
MKFLLGVALGLLLLLAPIAKADSFFQGEVVFQDTLYIDGHQINYAVEIVDIEPTGLGLWGFCQGPILQPTGNAYPYCATDDPIPGFAAFGSTYDIPLELFGLTDSFIIAHESPSIATPEPSTGGLLVAGCFLCAFVALRRRMA